VNPAYIQQMASDSKAIDLSDLRILNLLRTSGRISWRELGEQVGLASTSVAERVRRLERDGVITGYSAVVDPKAVGRTVRALIDVVLPGGYEPAEFERHISRRPEIVFAAFVTGAADYELLGDFEGAEGLDAFIRWLKTEAGAARTESKVVLRNVIG
jgi:Lrp/AsnC family transcriptional regulator, leucine-responsive regulatory protein